MGYAYAPYSYYGSLDLDVGSAAAIALILIAGFYLLILGFSILTYVLQSLGMYTIAQRRCINHPWLAWVPYGNLWILGSIADQYQYVSLGKVKNRRKVLLGLQIAYTVLALAMFGIGVYVAVQVLMEGGNVPVYIVEHTFKPLGFAMLLIDVAIVILAILLTVYQYVCLYNLFASCAPDNKVVFLLLCIFLSVTQPFLVFACRKKDRGMPPRRPDPAPIDPPTFEA